MATCFRFSCLENVHGQRSLAVYSPWGCKELDMTEQLNTQDKVVSGILQRSPVYFFSFIMSTFVHIWYLLLIIFIDTQVVLSLASGAYFGLSWSHFDMIPVVFIILLSDIVRYFWLIFYASCPEPLSPESWLLFLGNGLGDHNLSIKDGSLREGGAVPRLLCI